VGTTWPTSNNPQIVALQKSIISDLNDNGDAVGKFSTESAPYGHAFLLRGGSVIDLVPPLPEQSNALGINNNGLITGFLFLAGRGFVYDSVAKTAPIIIDPLPGQDNSIGNAINNSGAVAGNSGDHAILFVGGKLLDLGVASADDINDSGLVAGSIYALPPANSLAAVCDTSKPNPSFTTVPLPPGGFIGSEASAINNKGDVVGGCWTQLNDWKAFIFTKGASTDLNTLISGSSGWTLQSANDINDNGQIVGSGLLNGQPRPFLLTPISLLNPLTKLIALVGTIIGFQTIDGSGIIFVGGIPIPVGPWGPRVGDYVQKSDIIISLAVEQMATHIGNIQGQTAVRRAALEVARGQIGVLLEKLEQRR